METRTIDLKNVLGLVAEYDINQKLISPTDPFEVKAVFYPGAESNIHTHPFQDEYYKIHEGELELLLDKTWKTYKPGEEVHIPKNMVHGFRNRSGTPVVLTNIHTPGLDFGASLIAMEKLSKEGKVNGIKGFKNLAYLSQHSLKYQKTVVSIKPSVFLLKIVAKVGKLRGYKL